MWVCECDLPQLCALLLLLQLAMTAEAEKLVGASFGETMLHALGKVYESQSDIALGNIFQGAMAKMRLQGDSIR